MLAGSMPRNDLLRIRENPRKQELVVSLIVKVCKDKMKSAKHSKMRVLRLLKAKAQSDGAECRKPATVESRIRRRTDKPRSADYQKQDSGQQHSVFGDVLAFLAVRRSPMNGVINFPPMSTSAWWQWRLPVAANPGGKGTL
jgi:hypothetical protein